MRAATHRRKHRSLKKIRTEEHGKMTETVMEK